ncbi:MAG TPA: carbon monoxide dehydrogenase subunit G [Dongiaceae bacterium]|nr:carbon monoxide dehydrogenase subunit G [Dongiaceae bacterium]
MDMTGERRIAAPRLTVWRALNDAEVLKQAIPGCEEIHKVSDTEFAAKVTAKVGPVKARFGGKVTLSDLDPPNGYKISGEGQGGGAGFAKGGAEVRLESVDGGAATLLRYTVHATVGGKLAQIGSRLIEGAARKMADDFFDRFAAAVGAPAAPAAVPVPAEEKRPALSPLVWVGALIVIVVLLLLIFGR